MRSSEGWDGVELEERASDAIPGAAIFYRMRKAAPGDDAS